MVQEITNNEPGELEEEGLGQQVDRLLEQGYSQKEIRDQGFSPSLIRQRVRKRNKRLGVPPPESKSGNGGKGDIALTVKEKETVLPEWLEGQVSELFDGSVAQQKAFVAGMAIPLLGMRMWAEGCKPMLALMQTYQAGQAEAVKAAQGGAEDVAQQTVVSAMPYFKDMITEVSRNQAANPMQAMVVRMMEPMFQGVMNNLLGGMFKQPGQQPQGQQGQGLPPGWTQKEEKND